MVNINFPKGHRRSWPNINLPDLWARRKYAFCDQRREPVYESEDEVVPNLVSSPAKSKPLADAVVLYSRYQCEVILKNLLQVNDQELAIDQPASSKPKVTINYEQKKRREAESK